MGDSMQQAAAKYVKEGFAVFPICWPTSDGKCGCGQGHTGKQIGKAPLIKNWANTAARNNIRVLALWDKRPNANIGIPTDGLVVLDFDKDKGGLESKAAIEAKYGKLPRTRAHLTGGGGEHWIYRNPGDADIRGTTELGGYSGVDLRANGSQIVAPPSLHKSGNRYEVLDNAKIAPAPERLMKITTEQKPAAEFEAGELISEGNRNWWLFRRASGYRAKGDPEELIFQKVKIDYEQRCAHDPPMSDKELRACCHSAAKYEPEQKAAPATPRIISARDLMNKEFPPLIFAIPGIIPEGLTLLAGKPKAGKSFLALEAAYSVALGKNLMDGSQIERGSALVLGLEDGQRRLKDRVSKVNNADYVLKVIRAEGGGLRIIGNLGEGVPNGIGLASTWPRIGSGGIEELEKYLDEHPDVRLVVVDTIKRFTKKKGKGTAYDEDYDSVQPLQDLAIKRRLPIVGVCHTRKATADDALDTVSGTFGLTGGCDNILILQKEGEVKDGKEFRLNIISRDMESRELAVKFGNNCMWTLLGDAAGYFINKEQKAILELLEHEVLGPKEVAERLGIKEPTAKSTLWRMAKAGLLINDGGKYRTAGR